MIKIIVIMVAVIAIIFSSLAVNKIGQSTSGSGPSTSKTSTSGSGPSTSNCTKDLDSDATLMMNYLLMVYQLTDKCQWANLGNDGIKNFYNSLTFYYAEAPFKPTGKTRSFLYDLGICDTIDYRSGHSCDTDSDCDDYEKWEESYCQFSSGYGKCTQPRVMLPKIKSALDNYFSHDIREIKSEEDYWTTCKVNSDNNWSNNANAQWCQQAADLGYNSECLVYWPIHIYTADGWDCTPSDTCSCETGTSYMCTVPKPFPDNAWYEGFTGPNEWGAPFVCSDTSIFSGENSWSNQAPRWSVWTYPMKGMGYFYNTFKTSWAWNKIHYIIKYGEYSFQDIVNLPGICPVINEDYEYNWKDFEWDCDDLDNCCAPHGTGWSLNLGKQILDYMDEENVDYNTALDAVEKMYTEGWSGMEDPKKNWPYGTFFSYQPSTGLAPNGLDDKLAEVRSSNNFDSAQLLREPQNAPGGSAGQYPAYAFEITTNTPADSDGEAWDTFCSNTVLINPFDDWDNYNQNQYINPNVYTVSIDNYKPPDSYRQMFI